MLVYQRFALKVANMLGTSICPEAERKVYTQIVDVIASLDVDIKIRLRKGTHLEKFNNMGQAGLSSPDKKAALLQTIL